MKSKKYTNPNDSIERYKKQRMALNKNRGNLYRDYESNTILSNAQEYEAPEGSLLTEEDSVNTESFGRKTWNGIKGFVTESVPNFFTEDILNAIRMVNERRAKGIAEEKRDLLRRVIENENAIKLIDEYIGLNNLISSGQIKDLPVVKQQEVHNRINQLDNIFKSDEGRQNDAIRQIMYDTSSPQEGRLAQDVLGGYLSYGLNRPDDTEANSITDKIKKGLSNFWSSGIENPIQAFGNAFSLAGASLGKILTSVGLDNQKSGFITDRALQSVDKNSNVVQQLYIGNNIGSSVSANNKLREAKEYNSRAHAQYELELDKYEDDIKNGNWKIPLSEEAINVYRYFAPSNKPNTGITIDNLWDPKDVSDQWRKAQQENSGSIWHPVYMIPEIGSTLGMIEGMIETVGLNVAAEAAIRKLPSIVAGGPSKKAISMAIAAGDVEKAANLIKARELAEFSKTAGAAQAAIRAAEIGTGLEITTAQRNRETPQEAMGALSQRTLRLMNERNADLEKIYTSIKNYADDRGIDLSNFTPEEVIGEAIARNIPTNDPVFEEIKKDARKGLSKLISTNNALAVHDYLENLSFTSYGTKALAYFGKIKSGMINAVPNFSRVSAGSGRRTFGQVWRDMKINRDRSINISAMAAINPNSAMYARTMQAAYDGYVDNLAKNLIRNKKIFSGLALKRISANASDLLKRTALTQVVEGAEEGVQTTLQQRFESGYYDNNNIPEQQFSLAEVLEIPELTGYVADAMLGLHGKGDDEIVKSVIIGAFVGGIFPLAGRAITNFSNNPDVQNLRTLITQLKNDRVMAGLISNRFDEIADELKLRLFTEAFRRTGVNAQKLTKSLMDIKNNVDENSEIINKDFVDGDISLLNAAWYMYNNDKILNELKRNGIKKYSKEHKDIIVEGAKYIAYQNNIKSAATKEINKVRKSINDAQQIFAEASSDNTTEERKQLIFEQYPQLEQTLEELRKSYNKYTKHIDSWNNVGENAANELRSENSKKYSNATPEELIKIPAVRKFVEDNLIHSGDIVESRRHLVTEDFITRRGIEMLYNDGFKKALVDHINGNTTFQKIETPSFEQYVKDYVTEKHARKQVEIAKDWAKKTADLNVRLKEFQKLTGLDIDTDVLGGIVSTLNTLSQQSEKIVGSSRSISEFNSRIKPSKEGEQDFRISAGDAFGDEILNSEIEWSDSYEKDITSYLLNSAILSPISTIANAYKNPEDQDVPELNMAIFGDNENTYLSQDLDAFRQKQQIINDSPISDRKQGSADYEDLRQINKDASWKTILKNIGRNETERRRITHPSWTDDSAEASQQEEPQQEEPQVDESVEPQQDQLQSPADDTLSDELLSVITNADKVSDDIELDTENGNAAEIARRNKQRQRSRQTTPQDELAAEQDNKKDDDRDPHSEVRTERKRYTRPATEEKVITPKKPIVNDENTTVSDVISSVFIGNDYYYKYKVTTLQNGNTYIKYVMADQNGNVATEKPIADYGFTNEIPAGYIIDVSRLSEPQIGFIQNVNDGLYGMQISAIQIMLDGRAAIKTNGGGVLMLKREEAGPNVNEDVLNKISAYEHNALISTSPIIKRDGVDIISVETLFKLSNGDIIGKIEENGQTYYYVVSIETFGWNTKRYRAKKYNSNGQETDSDFEFDSHANGFTSADEEKNTNVVTIQYTQSNIPIKIDVEDPKTGNVVSTSVKQGVEDIDDADVEDIHDNEDIDDSESILQDALLAHEIEQDELQNAAEDVAAQQELETEKTLEDYQELLDQQDYTKEGVLSNQVDVDDDGRILIGGLEIDPALQEAIEIQNELLYELEFGGGIEQEDLSQNEHTKTESQTSDDAYDYASTTFFYKPNPIVKNKKTGEVFYDENGEPVYETMRLAVNGKDIRLPYKLKNGKEFSNKLSQKGWFLKVKQDCFYVVTYAQEALKYNEEHNITDIDALRDCFTVSLIFVDHDDKACYACSLKGLGKYKSEGVEIDPITGSPKKDKDGHEIKTWYDKNEERDFRNILGTIHTVRHAGKSRQEAYELERSAVAQNEYERLYGGRPVLPQENAPEEAFEQYKQDFKRWANKVDEWADSTRPLKKLHNESQDHYELRLKQRNTSIDDINNRTRYNLRQPGKKPLTNQQIDVMIDNLRKTRNTIIDAYLAFGPNGYVFPEKIRTDIRPETIIKSDGRYHHKRTPGDTPDLQNVTRKENPFGLSSDIQELNSQILSGKVHIGIGSGKVYANNKLVITDYREGNESTTYPGKGLAGKVCLIVSGEQQPQIPIMLSELKFNKQHGASEYPIMIGNEGDELRLCIDPVTGEVLDDKDGYVPSAAEAILYMLFGKLNANNFPIGTLETQREFANFFVNNGEHTILGDSKKEALLNYYAAKQLAVINNNLVIGMPIGRDQYRAKSYSAIDLFLPTEKSEKLRMAVVRAIANQIHWNTEKVTMNEQFGEETTANIAKELEIYFKQNPDEEEFVLCGIPEFTFNKHDLFELNPAGEPIRVKKNMTMVSWLLHSGKLLSDIISPAFIDPFVFAEGIKEDVISELKTKAQESGSLINGQDIDLTHLLAVDIQDKDKSLRVRSRIGAQNPNSPIAKAVFNSTQEVIDAMIAAEERANSILTQQHGPAVRVIGLDLPTLNDDPKLTADKMMEVIKNKIGTFISEIAPSLVGVDENIKLHEDSDTYATIDNSLCEQLMSRISKKWLVTARIHRDGYIKLIPQHYVGAAANPKKGSPFIINGVYQSIKTDGKFDESFARKWLYEKLGLTSDLIFVTNALLEGAQNLRVYATTNIALDVLSDQMEGQMIYSTSSGFGTQFHEAWHYVNLLLNSPKTQVRLYEEYVKTHKSLKGKTYGEIEEAMAEDFRKYVEGLIDNSISGKIKRFFNKVMDLVVASRKKSEYRKLFEAIQRGDFKTKPSLNRSAIVEFSKKYPSGVNLLYIVGYNDSDLANMSNILTARDFYDVSNAIVDFVIDRGNIITPEAAINLAGAGFVDVLKQLKEYASTLDQSSYDMIMDFYNNPAVLLKSLMNRFKTLGIIPKVKRFRKNTTERDVDESATAKEDSPENIYDRFLFTISKKDNVSFRAKLFLRQIPSGYFVPNEDGTKDIEYEYNPILPCVPKYNISDVAWNKILTVTNKIEGYGHPDENGKFPSNSFRGAIKNAAKADAFYAILDQKLDEIDDDTVLKDQIYSAVNSQKPNIMFHEIMAAQQFGNILSAEEYESLDPEDIEQLRGELNRMGQADIFKQWVLRNDNTLQAARNIPRRWSDALLLSGIIDPKEEKLAISKSYVDELLLKKRNIIGLYDTHFKNAKKLTSELEFDYYNELADAVVDLCNYLGIVMDKDVIDYFVSTISSSNDYKEKAKVLNDSFGKSTTGTIGNVVTMLKNNVGETKLIYNGSTDNKTQLKEPVPLSRVFSGTKLSSDITKLALSFNAIHPSSAEFGVRGPNKDMLYPTSQNNFQSTKLRRINTTGGRHATEMMKSPYARHSMILNTAKNFGEVVSEDEIFKLNLDVGIKDGTINEGVDYFGTTSLEDYIQKMFTLDYDPDYKPASAKNDYKSNESTFLVSPTMADKKTHYSISSKSASFKTSHDPVVGFLYPGMFYREDVQEYAKEKLGEDFDLDTIDEVQLMKIVQQWQKDTPSFDYRRFSSSTLLRFAGYFIDELEALELYYNRNTIKEIIKNPNLRRSNYHGKVKGGRLDFSGNGGKFRYFYDTFSLSENGEMNLNQKLNWLYELEKAVLSGKEIKLDNATDAELISNVSLNDIDPRLKKSSDFDGFELIRAELRNIRRLCFDRKEIRTGKTRKYIYTPSKFLLDSINQKLFKMADMEMLIVCTDQRYGLGEYVPRLGFYIPKKVPTQLLERYNARFLRSGLGGGSSSYRPYRNLTQDAKMFYALMANHTINTFTSVIEFEKVFSGDPAFYKWKDIRGKFYQTKQTITYKLPSGKTVTSEQYVSNLGDKFTDKIKRLGSILSPGDEMRGDLSKAEQQDPYLNADGYLNSHNYSVLVVDDIIAQSKYLDRIINPKFKRDLIADHVRNNNIPEIDKYIELVNVAGKNKYNKERLIDDILINRKMSFYDELKDVTMRAVKFKYSEELADYNLSFEDLPDEHPGFTSKEDLYKEFVSKKVGIADYIYNILPVSDRKFIDDQLKDQVNPYRKITVSDAQVFVRPALYRKIRMRLGQWSVEPDPLTGYSDEEAYRILEEDPSWQSDPEKSKKVAKLELFPFKLSYVSNEPIQIADGVYLNVPLLDKQAVFPLFKYAASNQVGNDLYNRMNKKDNEIDMIAFVSAVKVGSHLNIPNLYGSGSTPIKTIGKMDDVFLKDNDTRIKYNISSDTGEDIERNLSEDCLPISIQDLRLLRYQLNTRAHHDSDRDLGTQAAKLGFSNIIDNALYGKYKKDNNPRSGRQIKQDIIACINALTDINSRKLESTYFKNKGGVRTVNSKAVHDWMQRVVSSNNLGDAQEEIMSYAVGGVAECLSSRSLFEQTVSAAVNDVVVDITTNGGTAIQQSMFGFNDYDNSSVMSDEDFELKNKTLQSDIDIIDVLTPTEVEQLRKNGVTTVEDFVNSKDYILTEDNVKNWLSYHNINIGDKSISSYAKLNGGKELKWQASENTMQVLLSANFFKSVVPKEYQTSYNSMRKWLKENNIIGDNAKPFGIGYRIPTQGMSSMFVFQVADILPEQSGDLIIVPREFTAQTGSDFDVDKLFLATFNYTMGSFVSNGQNIVPTSQRTSILNTEAVKKARGLRQLQSIYGRESEEAVQNLLLQDYIDVISDERNYAESRASIDTFTNKIHDNVLSWLRGQSTQYLEGMYELLPSFQSLKKDEFKVGKDGIGSFALNTVNIAMTQLSHLSLDYGQIVSKDYGFGHLDEIDGRDKLRISGWLSAMVNAHVDVAKDPYIFTLNVNSATYNYTNFLLRAGMGISTFTFLALPILIEFTTRFLNSGGMYGRNIDGNGQLNISVSLNKRTIIKELMLAYINEAERLMKLIPVDYIKSHADTFLKINEALLGYKYKYSFSNLQKKQYKKPPKIVISRNDVFDFHKAKKAILDMRNPDTALQKLGAVMFLLLVMTVFLEIEPCAQAVSDLVMNSRIDTKKFGNDIAKQKNFLSKMTKFKYASSAPWIIRGASDLQNQEPANALEVYYEKSFLKDKFDKAHSYTKGILSKELFSGTDLFDRLFCGISENINGTFKYYVPKWEIDKKTHARVPLYKYNKDGKIIGRAMDERTMFLPYSKEDNATEVAKALDNVARFNMLINSVETNSEDSSALPATVKYLPEPTENDTYIPEGPIDFTFGGNYRNIFTNVVKLLFGNGIEKSLPMRVKDFIAEVLNDPYSDKAVGIVEDGKLVNLFLQFLNPIARTKEIPIDRLNLNESVIRIGSDMKSILMSHFGELLTHQNSEVRRLARDIVLYGYYTTYDTSSVNSILDLTPPMFKKQYIDAISKSIKEEDGISLENSVLNFLNLSTLYGESFNNDVLNNIAVEDLYYDVIARNYWYNDSIVKRVTEYGDGKMSFSSSYIEYRDVFSTDKRSGQVFAGLIVTTNFGGAKYVKIVKKQGSMLYKRVGKLLKFLDDKQLLKDAYVYIVAQKAGLHVGKNHIYEFHKPYFVPSMFEWNKLPSKYETSRVKEYLFNLIKLWNKQTKKYVYEYQDDDFIMPYDNLDGYNKLVYFEAPKQKTKKIYDGSVEIVLNKSPKKMAQRNASLIIKFTDSNGAANYSKDLVNKTVFVDINDQEALYKLAADIIDKQIDPEVGQSLYMDFDENLFVGTKEEEGRFLEQMVKEYSDQMSREQVVEQFGEYIPEYTKVRKMANAANIAMQTMIAGGVSLLRVYCAGLNNSTRVALNAYQNNIDDFSVKFSYVYASKEEYLNDNYESVLTNIASPIPVENLVVDFNQTEESSQNMREQEQSAVYDEMNDFIKEGQQKQLPILDESEKPEETGNLFEQSDGLSFFEDDEADDISDVIDGQKDENEDVIDNKPINEECD